MILRELASAHNRLTRFLLRLKMISMVVRTEGNFRAADNTELFYQTWTAPEARGTLVVTHGFAEHSECYDQFFAKGMNARAWNVIGWDLRGHGRSEGKRGHIDRFDLFSEDLASFIESLKKQGKLAMPFALVGHSMGGLIVLRYLASHGASGASALALSSPLLGVAVAVPPIKDFASRILLRIAPSLTLGNELRYADLSRDPEMLKTYEKDPLRHDKISPALYLGMLETIAYVKTRGAAVSLPTLLQMSGDDRIVSSKESRAFFDLIAAKDKKLLVYDESYHEIFNDLDRETVFSDLDSFLKKAMGF